MKCPLTGLALAWVAACGANKAAEPPKPLTAQGVTFEVPATVEAGKVKLAVSEALPKALEHYSLGIESHYKLLKLIHLQPDGMQLPRPAMLTATVMPACAAKDAVAVTLGGTRPEPLATTPVADSVKVVVTTLGTIAVMCPLNQTTLLGSPAELVWGATEISMSGDCPTWITPEAAAIQAMAKDPKRFSIDADHVVQLDTKLELRVVDDKAKLAKAEAVLASGGGDRVNLSVLFASLLAAKGYPVRLASGEVALGEGATATRGVTQWAEVVLDAKPYFVDVTDPTHVRLLPLAEATTAFKLGVHRTCAKYPAGGSTEPAQWSIEPPKPPEAETAALLEQRKQLDKKCNHGADKAACMERGKLDDRLKKHLDELLARHKELETKCKAGKDAEACTQRDQLAELGKTVKAQLDAKP